RPDHGELFQPLRAFRQQFGEVNPRDRSFDRFEASTDLGWSLRFGIKGIDLAVSSQLKQDNTIQVTSRGAIQLLMLQQAGESDTAQAQSSNPDEVPPAPAACQLFRIDPHNFSPSN